MTHDQERNKEAFQHQEFIQFSDGHIALGFRTPGDLIEWEGHKYADVEIGSGLAIIATEGGKRIAVGQGIAVQLPELDRSTGEFGKVGETVSYAKFEDVTPQGLPAVEIGKPWIADPQDPVKDVLLDYKMGGRDESYEQSSMPNPFDSARAHIDRVAQVVTAQSH